MSDFLERGRMVLGDVGVSKIQALRLAVFGLGGVGGYVVEALARCGVGRLDLIDHDTVSPSNINRQIYALNSTLGRYKADVARERVLDINPDAEVNSYRCFYDETTQGEFDLSGYDYIVDCIDSVKSKVLLIENAQRAGVKIISAMGAGNKRDPLAFEVADIYKTSVCPLAKVMRTRLKKSGIKKLKVVYSREYPTHPADNSADADTADGAKRAVGSLSFVVAAMAQIIASEVIKDIIISVNSEAE